MFPMADSKPALLCTLAKQSTCNKEIIPCSDTTCQKAKMRDVFPPPPVCFHRTYLFRLSSLEFVCLVPSQDPTCQTSPVSSKYLYVLHHLYFTATLRGRQSLGQMWCSKRANHMSPGRRRLKNCVRPRSSSKNINSLCVNVFKL